MSEKELIKYITEECYYQNSGLDCQIKSLKAIDKVIDIIKENKELSNRMNFLIARENKLQIIENIANKDNFCISELIAEIRCK